MTLSNSATFVELEVKDSKVILLQTQDDKVESNISSAAVDHPIC